MATQYIINFADNTDKAPFIVQPGERNKRTSLDLFGMGAISYGEGMNENLIRLLENFSHPQAPRNPTKGQLWYDSLNTLLKYQDGSAAPEVDKVYTAELNGNDATTWASQQGGIYTGATTWVELNQIASSQGWVPVGGSVYSFTEPDEKHGLWFDQTELELKIWDGANYVNVSGNYVRQDGVDTEMTGDLLFKREVSMRAYDAGPSSAFSELTLVDSGNTDGGNDVILSSMNDIHMVIDNNDNASFTEFSISRNAKYDTEAAHDRLFTVAETGTVTVEMGDVDMKSNKIVNVGEPTSDNEAVRKIDLDTGLGERVQRSGDSMSGSLNIAANSYAGLHVHEGRHYGLMVDTSISTDSGGVIVKSGDQNNDEYAFVNVNHEDIMNFNVNATLGSIYTKGNVVCDGDHVKLSNYNYTTFNSIAAAADLAPRGYVDSKISEVSPVGQVPIINYAGVAKDGDVKVEMIDSVPYISIYASGWRQIFPAVYS